MTGTLRILTVCSHNRTRSVMMAGLLTEHLAAAGVRAHVFSTGTVAEGAPATDRARRLLAERGIDVSGHRSTLVDRRHVDDADLIVCAERDHAVWISGRYPGTFGRCFTLPELIRLAEPVGVRGDRDIATWLTEVGGLRATPMEYLEHPPEQVGELADPTGMSPATWDTAFAEIDDLTERLAHLLA